MITRTAMMFSHLAAPTAGLGSDPWVESAELADPDEPPGAVGIELGTFGAELGILGSEDFSFPSIPLMPLTGYPQSE